MEIFHGLNTHSAVIGDTTKPNLETSSFILGQRVSI